MSHAHRTGAGPRSAWASSISRRSTASPTLVTTRPVSWAEVPWRTRPATTRSRRSATAATASASAALDTSPTRWTGSACSSRSRSVEVTMPTGLPLPSTRGRWWMLRRTSSSSTSRASWSGLPVTGSGVMTSATGVVSSRPRATTRLRRSRSVRMPTRRGPSVTSTDEIRSRSISTAASRTVVSRATVTGVRATRSPTRVRSTSPADSGTPAAGRATAWRSNEPAWLANQAVRAGWASRSVSRTSAGTTSSRVSSMAVTSPLWGAPVTSASPPMVVPAPPRSTSRSAASRSSTAPERTTSSSETSLPPASTTLPRRR